MKEKISFERDGIKLTGNLFTPEGIDEDGQYKAIIVQGSFNSVKEQMSGTYAKKFAELGFVALAFDYSHYGESEGTPRQFEDPAEKTADLKAAVTHLSELPYVSGVSMVGVCTSAGNTAYLVAEDERIQSIATVAAFLPTPELFDLMLGGKEGIARRFADGEEAKKKYDETGEETLIPVYSETDTNAVNYGPAGTFDYYLNEERGNVPNYTNAYNVASWEKWLSFDPITKASEVTVPAIVVHSDESAFPESARSFYEALQGPKGLVWSDGNHYDYYDSEKQIDNAAKNVARFFNEHSA